MTIRRENVAGVGVSEAVPTAFEAYYRGTSALVDFEVSGELLGMEGYFTFEGATCFGRATTAVREDVTAPFTDLSAGAELSVGRVRLPFDLCEITTALRQERYCRRELESGGTEQSRRVYYFIRPLLPVPVRKHLQRVRLRGWEDIPFPRWPVDFSVETLMQGAMKLAIQSLGTDIPFIWFWPDAAPACAMMTHDVEAEAGRDFCDQLMDMNDAHGVKSAFQVVPEVRYNVTEQFLDRFRQRGFEVNVHDLNHDGRLFLSKRLFLERVQRINNYGKAFKSDGFRAGAMYRRQDWFDALEFSYDMSVPNAAHLEPQRGGCCTVLPYFVGSLVELPLTTTQDYSLFHILGEYSVERWKQQIDLIRAKHGLISFIAHPDYLIEKRARSVYVELLAHLQRLSAESKVWLALPGDVNRWWRNRALMQLVRTSRGWRVEGPDSDRAIVAFATIENDRVAYRFDAGAGLARDCH